MNDKPTYEDLVIRLNELESELSNLRDRNDIDQNENGKINKERINLALESAKAGTWEWNLKTNQNFWSDELWEVYRIVPYSVEPSYEAWKNIIHPDDREISEKIVQEAANNSTELNFEFRILDKQGIEYTLLSRGKPIFDNNGIPEYYIGVVIDITDRKKQEYQLIKSKEKAEENEIYLQTLLSIIDDVIVTRDLNDNVVFFNTAFDNVTKYLFNQPAYKGINTLKLLPKEAREFWENILLKVKNGSNNSYEYEFKSFDNKTNYYITSHIPIIKNSEIIGTLEISKDITLFKEREIELQKAKEKAEENDRLKTAFLQNMSHEIRTPMNAICGFSGQLNKPDLSDEKRKSFVSIIQNSSHQLLSIVTDILTISSIETKQEKPNISKVCINNVILDLLSVFKQQSINQNISLYAKKELSDIQSEILTDKTKITQIITNLLTNALKFTHEGFIEFGYNLKTDIVPAVMEFYVKDTGIGIDTQKQIKIFERFVQADKSIQMNYGGTGLGLSISKGFVELLDGKIWVQSELTKGATFYFTIPYKPVNEIDKSISLIKHNGNFRTILVAEDEEYNFLLIEEYLSNMDLKLIHAKDGKETIEICKSNPNIDLILMDIKMPIMSGDTAAKMIKEFRPDLIIIAQSGYALEHELEKYSGIFDDYIIKPIKENELKEKVMKYINNQVNKI